MLSTPITEQARQKEWNTICTIVKNNGFPLQNIHNLRNERTRIQKTKNTSIQTQRKKWITFTYHSPLVHKVTDLFKSTNLNVAFRTCNTIRNQLCDRSPQNKMNSSGIYRLQCNTCNKLHVSQTGSSIEIRHREYIQYTKTNNPISAYALHILTNRHKYGSPEYTMQLIKAFGKGKVMNCWESL